MKKTKPVIGIAPAFDYNNARLYLKEGYFEAVIKAGGLPVVFSVTKDDAVINEYFEMCDGLLLTGGPDIDPKYYGEMELPVNGDISPHRDYMETILSKKAIEKKKPILGICRGIQIMNVALGGTLYQDIHSQIKGRDLIKHSQTAPVWYPVHEVGIAEGSLVAESFSGKLNVSVNSIHHQAIKDLAPGFKVTSRSSDGIIESIEYEGHPFGVGVQWHPELMWREDREYLKVIEGLINASKI